ncbi:MAG: tRNA (guanosine(37)-N1)-methyltransferase TrmD [Acidimicrobiia bacterium]|nr:tRNA (guanosine(37)-N1)-methyltransferase TrmD [Acidimicrobiia bacterium]
MKVTVLTLFPEMFHQPLSVSIVQRAVESGALAVDLYDIRTHGKGRHRQVDDAPFGGGAGMVMGVEPIVHALEAVESGHRVVFTPAGKRLHQVDLDRWVGLDHLILVCGRYEGIDQRVADHFADEEISLGDFVLAGGEVPALAVIEGLARLLPDVVGNPESVVTESFRDEGLLEEPVYTRPALFRGIGVPEVLLSGDHEAIAAWRREQRVSRTERVRPELL